MPEVSAMKIGDVIPVRCSCGKENHPMPFIPGEYWVKCNHSNKTMKVFMKLRDGIPRIFSYFAGDYL